MLRMRLGLLIFAALFGFIIGCRGSSKTSEIGADEYQTLRSLSNLYNLYLSEHGGRAPRDQQQFREFVESKDDFLQKIGKTADELLTSPRNGAPMGVVCGRKPPTGAAGVTYFAYEMTAVEGKYLVVASRGIFEEIDEARFQQLFPDVDK